MEDIVKVTIKGSSGYGSYDEAYKDKVMIDRESISYVYKPLAESEFNFTRKWSYRTTSAFFGQLFDALVAIIPEIFTRDEKEFVTDIGGTEFVITYANKTKQKKLFFLPGDEFKNCFAIIRHMVPACETIPEVLMTSDDYESENG